MFKKVVGFVFYLVVVTAVYPVDKLALTMKTRGEIQLKSVLTGSFGSLKRGAALYDGDKVITGDDALAIVLFLDDKTQLKLKENSETEITGSRSKGGISKRLNLAYGGVKASVEKQKGEFIVVTPTSVASIKGTEFWLISDPDSGDVLIGLSGTVELTNNFTGQSITVSSGDVVESTPEGRLNVLVTVKISGEATAAPSGGRFSLSDVTVISGDVESGDLSGLVVIEDNTLLEGASIEAGLKVTVTGTLDEQSGNVTASLMEVTAPITVEATASSSVSANLFTISDVVLAAGEAESLPTAVKITDGTIIEGGDVISGAEVTVTGNYNEETGVIEATRIVVVIPELRVTGSISSVVSGNEIEISGIEVVEGNLDVSALSGKIIIVEGATIEGELVVGAKVTVSGRFDLETGAINARRVVVSQLVLSGVVTSPVINNEFEVGSISVVEGDIDPSTLSGIIRITDKTEIEGGDVVPGVRVTITGVAEEGTGVIIALQIVIAVARFEGEAASAIVNNQFEMTDVSVIEGEVDLSTLSGIVKVTVDTEIEGGDVYAGVRVVVAGSVEESTGDIVASKVVVIVSERELLFELEDRQGNRKELIIKFQ